MPEAIYILANKESKRSTAKTLYNSPKLINIKSELKKIWQNKNKACLVSFNIMGRNFLFNIDELKQRANLVKVVQLKDGEIYIITNK